MTYDFTSLGFDLIVVNPTIEDKIIIESYDVETKIGSVVPTLTTANGSSISPVLTNVNIPTVNEATLRTKTLDKLKEFEV